MGNSQSRRKFLVDATKSLGLLGISPVMSNFIIQTLSTEVLASGSATGGTDKLYIFFAMPGGPPRWLFDLPLTPTGNLSQFSHKGIGTYVGMDGISPVVTYKPWQDPVSKYHLPSVWGANPSGEGKSFTNCLSNAVFFRGLDFELNNHDLGRQRNQSPIIGGLSIAGLLAQQTKTPFPAASSGSITTAFRAEKVLSPVSLNYTVSATANPVKTAMSYFAGSSPVQNLAVEQALSEFDRYATKNGFAQKNLTEAKERSDALVKQGVNTFNEKWQPTFDKYSLKVKEALSQSNVSSFLDSKSIARPADKDGKSDMRIRFDNNRFIEQSLSDLKQMVNDKTVATNLAATFATVEILITMGLTQVVTTDISSLVNLALNNTGGVFSLNLDQHFVGSLVSTIATTFYYRAILNCTEELVLTLKERNLFDRTVIHFGAEFNRIPRADGSGSDHGFQGCSALLISGMIKSTAVVGNIRPEPKGTPYEGVWGLSAGHPLTEGHPLRLNDLAKTVCGMLGLKNVSNNGYNILKYSSGKWEIYSDNRGESKNV